MLRNTALTALLCIGSIAAAQESNQPVNDSNTPLHLLKPAYQKGYGVVTAEEVKQDMDRILHYLENNTPTRVVDSRTGSVITDYAKIDEHSQLERGAFRLASYEWGVTYSAMLSAFDATGDEAYRNYAYNRFNFLAGHQHQISHFIHHNHNIRQRRQIQLLLFKNRLTRFCIKPRLYRAFNHFT